MHENILRLLQNSDSFVSGEEISSEIGISRAAVWKNINSLRKKGFTIEAVPSKGYRLVQTPDLSSDEIISKVRGNFWKRVVFFESLDSTNDFAASLSMEKGFEPASVVIADRQAKGKGRLGRRWISPDNVNIYMSILLKPEINLKDAPLLTLLAAVACAAVLREIGEIQIEIKWPNDIMVSGKKLGGILTETRTDPDRILTAIIGIGINVNYQAGKIPDSIKNIATSLKGETGKTYKRTVIIIRILREFEGLYREFIKNGSALLIQRVRELSSTIGRRVQVTIGDKAFKGLAENIDSEGRLILKTEGGDRIKINAGDVKLLR